MIGIIYRTTNLVDGKKYIGKHKCTSTKYDGYLGSGTILKAAISKMKREKGNDWEKYFRRQIIRIVQDDEDINELEKYYIKINNCVLDKTFYNITEGGDGAQSGEAHPNKSEAARKKVSERFKGRTKPIGAGTQPIKIYCEEHLEWGIFNSITDACNFYNNIFNNNITVSHLSHHIRDRINRKSCGKDFENKKLHWKRYDKMEV